ncbi:MAG: sel1 repeat family protein [Proteobacteria bacterium]|nr:sel1 repeat family protein [Pseudomonadota bacterium]
MALLIVPVLLMLTEEPAAAQKVDEGLATLIERAEAGDAEAQYNLGALYSSDGPTVQKNDIKAVKWYRMSAENGYAEAQVVLGLRYAQGDGIPKNFAKAFMWYGRAAEQGHAHAQLLLAGAYGLGEGVPKNRVEAYKWAALSKAMGNPPTAELFLIKIARMMTTEQIAEAQELADEWWEAHKRKE